MQKKHAIITGSSRGIGFGLANEFLKRNYTVTISGTTDKSTEEAYNKLSSKYSSDDILSVTCNVKNYNQLENLWQQSFTKFGRVDIWVNNAGIGQENLFFEQLSLDKINDLVDINIKGVLYGSQVSVKNMQKQGFGAIYNMEGFGSDGRKMQKIGLYGTTKRALNYFTESLILETKNSKVIVGLLSPGMVLTDLLTSPVDKQSEDYQRFAKIVNILGDKVETVTPFLVEGMINNTKHGKAIRWLTTGKVMKRFMFSSFKKRNLI